MCAKIHIVCCCTVSSYNDFVRRWFVKLKAKSGRGIAQKFYGNRDCVFTIADIHISMIILSLSRAAGGVCIVSPVSCWQTGLVVGSPVPDPIFLL